MGQKVNPHGLRVGVIKDWDSRWYANDQVFGDTLVSDYKIRKYLKDELQKAGVPKVEIERTGNKVTVFVHCEKPGMVIGQKGETIEKIKKNLEKMLPGYTVSLNAVEVKQPDLVAQLVAEKVAAQLENRVSFRRAMKMAIRNTMRNGAKGIKISCGGRLGGAEIARTEHYHEGTIPLQTLRANIDYGFWEANTTYGKIGVKVWIYTGEVLSDVNRTPAQNAARNDRRPGDRRNGDRRQSGDRKPGERRNFGDRKPGERRPGNGRFGDRNAAPARPVERTPRVAPAPAAAPTEGGEN